MKRTFFNTTVILLLIVGSVNFNFASLSAISLAQKTIPTSNSCINVTINNNEGVIHIVIVGTSQGEGVLEFYNAKKEAAYTQTIKTWNERTDLDIELSKFLIDDYVVSFTSTTMKCNSEFSLK